MSIYAGDAPIKLVHTFKADPETPDIAPTPNTSATLLEFQVTKPDGTKVNVTAQNLDTDTTGLTMWGNAVGVFVTPGDYKIHPYREFGGDSRYHSDPVYLTVLPS
jgi:hypothetical protein